MLYIHRVVSSCHLDAPVSITVLSTYWTEQLTQLIMHHSSSPHTHSGSSPHTNHTPHHTTGHTQKQLLHHFPFCAGPASLLPLYVSPTETLKIRGERRGMAWCHRTPSLFSILLFWVPLSFFCLWFPSFPSLPFPPLPVQFLPLELKHGICHGLHLTLSHSFDPIPLIWPYPTHSI